VTLPHSCAAVTGESAAWLGYNPAPLLLRNGATTFLSTTGYAAAWRPSWNSKRRKMRRASAGSRFS
jgi:hypothetical protein